MGLKEGLNINRGVYERYRQIDSYEDLNQLVNNRINISSLTGRFNNLDIRKQIELLQLWRQPRQFLNSVQPPRHLEEVNTLLSHSEGAIVVVAEKSEYNSNLFTGGLLALVKEPNVAELELYGTSNVVTPNFLQAMLRGLEIDAQALNVRVLRAKETRVNDEMAEAMNSMGWINYRNAWLKDLHHFGY